MGAGEIALGIGVAVSLFISLQGGGVWPVS